LVTGAKLPPWRSRAKHGIYLRTPLARGVNISGAERRNVMPNENEKSPQKQNQGNSGNRQHGNMGQPGKSSSGRREQSEEQPNRGKNAGPSSQPSSPSTSGDIDDLDIDNPRH
jgi:hypothetical protein